MLPAILYFPLLGASYFIFDLFHTETVEIQDKTLQTTEFLNPELPGAQIKDDGIGSKYENMAKSWGKIQDYSAVDNIEREETKKNKEEYESQYTQDDIALLTEQQQEKDAAAEIAAAKAREQEALAELEKALAEARLKGQNTVMPPADTDSANTVPPQGATISGTIDEESRAVKTPSADKPANEVVRKVKTTSDYFNTLAGNVHEPKLIQANLSGPRTNPRYGWDGTAARQVAPARRRGDWRVRGEAGHVPVRYGERFLVRTCERRYQQHPCE